MNKLTPEIRAVWQVVRPLVPWFIFGLILFWAWRLESIFTSIPAYGDNLEAIWTIDWWFKSLIAEGKSPVFTDVIFHPEGWQTSSQSYSPILLLFTIPFTFIGGAAFAYNSTIILLFAFTFAGVIRLARTLGASLWLAILTGILATFWGFVWLRLAGHWQILWGVAFLPWMAWSLEQSLKTSSRSKFWLVLAGLLWALSIGGSLYFIFLGGLVVAGWILGQLMGRRLALRRAITDAFIVVLTTGVLSIPVLMWFWSGIREYNSPLPDIYFLNNFGASVNSIPVPFLGHPWLGSFSRLLYTGPFYESAAANLGLATFVLVLATLALTWKIKRFRPLFILFLVGLILAVGPTLKWNGESVQTPIFRPINTFLWQVGHQLKPGVFPSELPPPPFEEAVPLPGLLISAIVPYWEGARTTSRYMLLAVVSFFLIASMGIKRLKPRWLQFLIAAILIVEIVPPPVEGVSYPPEIHPAYEWLSAQTLGEEGIIDLQALDNERLSLPIGGNIVYATGLHNQSTAAGVGSIFPQHGFFLREWLFSSPHPFNRDEFITLLRGYHTRYVLLHMLGENEQHFLDAAKENRSFAYQSCYPPPNGRTPWPYPICVFEILPASSHSFNAHFDYGWSAMEEWGIWAEGEESQIRWIATDVQSHSLDVEAFPYCLESEQQTIRITANGKQLAYYEWQECEDWSDTVDIPEGLVGIGWNILNFEYGFSARPNDVTGGENPDPRSLSVGFTRIEVAR
jgi:hypothetical protein